MMTRLSLLSTLLTMTFIAYSQEKKGEDLKVQDLDFLIGKWEISFDLYNAKKPNKGVVSKEKGFQICEYALATNDEPMYIICTGEVTNEKGRKRTFQESIRYNRFLKSFVRYGLFSHWPEQSRETLSYDPISRTLTITGTLGYSKGRIERYYDTYVFNNELTSYQRTHFTNLSDMPIMEFNKGLTGSANKSGGG